MIRYYRNARWPQLQQDAPPVPPGLRPQPGVEVGCGAQTCVLCYEPDDNTAENLYDAEQDAQMDCGREDR